MSSVREQQVRDAAHAYSRERLDTFRHEKSADLFHIAPLLVEAL